MSDASAIPSAGWTPSVPANGWPAFFNAVIGNGADLDGLQIDHVPVQSGPMVLRGCYRTLADVLVAFKHQQDAAPAGTGPTSAVVLTDILTIDGANAWTLPPNMSLFLCARIIVATNGASIDIGVTTTGESLVGVFSTYVQGQLAITNNGSAVTTISGVSTSPGILIDVAGKPAGPSPAVETASLATAMAAINATDDVASFLYNSYALAANACDSNPGIASDMLAWVNAWAVSGPQDSTDFVELAFQSATLANLLRAESYARDNNAHPVPNLSKDVYQALVGTVSAYVAQLEASATTLLGATTIDESIIAAAKTFQQVAGQNDQMRSQLAAQAQSSLTSAEAAVSAAKNNCTMQQIAVEAARDNLVMVGIPKYKREQQFEAAFSIVKSLTEFVIGAALVVAGDEAAAPAVAGSASAIGHAAQSTRKIEPLLATIKRLKGQLEVFSKTVKLTSEIKEATAKSGSPSQVPAYPGADTDALAPGSDGYATLAAWDAFLVEFNAQMAPLVKAGVDGASDYQTAVQAMVAYGRALTQSQMACLQASQHYQMQATEAAFAAQQADDLQRLVIALAPGGAGLQALQRQVRRRVVHFKLTVFTLLRAYAETYFYWALVPYSPPVSMASVTSTDANRELVDMGEADYRALSNFGSQVPQDMTSVTVPMAVQSLATVDAKSGTWLVTVTPDNAAIAQWARVRLTRLRVWLDGAGLYDTAAAEPIIVTLRIASTGLYEDRDPSNAVQRFSASPYAFTFEYTVTAANAGVNPDWRFAAAGANTVAKVNVDGAPAIDMANSFIEPTPCSTWSVMLVAPPSGPGIDFSKVSTITLELQGSAIALGGN